MIKELLTKRWFRYAILCAVLVAILWWTIRVLTTGTVVIETNRKDADIYIVKGVLDNSETRKKIGKGKTKRRMSPGLYTAIAIDGSAETKLGVQIRSRQTEKKQLNLEQPSQPNRLSDYRSVSIIKQGSTYRFLNKGIDEIYELNNSDAVGNSIFPGSYPVYEIKWINFDNAVFRGRDGILKTIKGGRLSDLGRPNLDSEHGEVDELPAVASSFDVNSKGEVVVLLKDKLVYYQSVDSAPRIISSGINEESTLRLSFDGRVFLFTDSLEGVDTTEESALLPSIINVRDGRQQDVDLPNSVNTVMGFWSPDGTKLLYGSQQATGVYNFTTSQYYLVSSVIPTNVGSGAWLNNDALLLADNAVLWVYNINSGQLQKVSNNVGLLDYNNSLFVSDNIISFGITPGGPLGNGGLFELKLP